MGHVYQDVGLTADKTKKVRMLVDTGASYTMIPTELAKELGVKTMRKRFPVELADGRRIKLKAGSAIVQIDGREAPITVYVGPGHEPLLGVEALEALGLTVDPTKGRLRPTRSYAVRL